MLIRTNGNATATWLGAIATAATVIVMVIAIIVQHQDSKPSPAPVTRVSGSATIQTADTINNNTTYNTVVNTSPAGTAQPRKSRGPEPERDDGYIDTNVRRVEGMTNVAVRVVALSGSEVGAIEGAAARALRQRGFNVLPLFRERFAKEGLDRKLFEGDASLARSLQLSRYCDRIVLGEVRFFGPSRSASSGYFIREAVIVFRLIDPRSGQVMGEELEIPVKGGGNDAEASTVDALRTLVENIPGEVSAWIRS